MIDLIISKSSEESVFQYLDQVLLYFKECPNISFSKWPEYEINYSLIQKKNKFFYEFAQKWFKKNNFNIIIYKEKHRYLSSFVLAAEYPPSLGIKKIVESIINKYGWDDLIQKTESIIEQFISSCNLKDFSVAQKVFLKKDSEGFYALLELIKILISFKVKLDHTNLDEEYYFEIAKENNIDILLAKELYKNFESDIIGISTNRITLNYPNFNYRIINKNGHCLVIEHNLLESVKVKCNNNFDIYDYDNFILQIISSEDVIDLKNEDLNVNIEKDNSWLLVTSKLESSFFKLTRRNTTLRDIKIIIKNKYNFINQLLVHIKRDYNFLVFDKNYKEIISRNNVFNSSTIYLVPLRRLEFDLFKSLEEFDLINDDASLPIFLYNGKNSNIEICGVQIYLSKIPFNLRLNSSKNIDQYFYYENIRECLFFNKNLKIYLEMLNEKEEKYQIQLFHCFKENRSPKQINLKPILRNNYISPLNVYEKDGLYELIIKMDNLSTYDYFFLLLPISSAYFETDKRIVFKMRYEIKSIEARTNINCNFSYKNNDLVLDFLEYGEASFNFSYYYILKNNNYIKKLNFKYKVIPEIIGHFSKDVYGVDTPELDLYKDFVRTSYIEIKNNSFRKFSQYYDLTICFENVNNHLIYPLELSYKINLTQDIFTFDEVFSIIESKYYSRIIISIKYNKIDIFKVYFSDKLYDLNNINGYVQLKKIKAIDIYSLNEKFEHPINSRKYKNSIIFGVSDNEEEYIISNGFISELNNDDNNILNQFIYYLCTNSDPKICKELLYEILKSVDYSFEFILWLTKVNKKFYIRNNLYFCAIFDIFPIIILWSELAINPLDKKTQMVTSKKESKFYESLDEYFIPYFNQFIFHPRFSIHLITVTHLDELFSLGLLPNIKQETTVFKIVFNYFSIIRNYTNREIQWVCLFWFYNSCKLNNLLNNFNREYRINLGNQNYIVNYTNALVKDMPYLEFDLKNNQDIKLIFEENLSYYIFPIQRIIPNILSFFNSMKEFSFSNELNKLLDKDCFIYIQPNLDGLSNSSKWQFIIFFSLIVVSKQLNRESLLNNLNSIWTFKDEEYKFLLKWITTNNSTKFLFRIFTLYWFKCFWEDVYV